MLHIRDEMVNDDDAAGREPIRRHSRVFAMSIVGLAITLLAACGSGSASGSSSSPAVPTGIAVTAGNDEATITWGAVAGATSYNIYRSTTKGSQGTKVGSSSTTSYVDSTVINGNIYFYEITADNSAGESPASSQSAGATPAVPVIVPGAPTGVNATAGNAQVTVTWTTVTGATSYNVYRSTNLGSQGAKVGTSTTLMYADSTALNGTTYFYEITASNAAGEGPASTQSAAATPAMPVTLPSAPTGVNATAGNGQVTVSWTAVSGATLYNIYRSTTQGSQGSKVGSNSTTMYSDTTAINGRTYYYVVTAVNAAGEGPTSTQSAAATAATTWKSVKFGGGGYVPGLIFHPTTANLRYARTDVGGAYRWNQATASWVPITDGLGFGGGESEYHGIESIAVDPNNDQVVYLAAGMYTSEGNGRLYISSDRGDHWTYVSLPFPLAGNSPGRAIGERLIVDPNKPSTLFYATRTAGLWKSVDSGLTWAQVTSLSSAQLTQNQVNALGVGSAIGAELVVLDTGTKGSGTATQTLYVAIAPDYVTTAGLASNLYKSTDGGASWTPVSTPISGYYIPHMVRAADGIFYVVFTTGSGPGATGPARLYKFDGSNWTLLEDPNAGTSGTNGLGGVSVSGTGASTRIALGVTDSWVNYSGQKIIQLSDDDGQTWREIAATMPHTPAADPFWGWPDDVEIDPSNSDHVLYVHGGGVWETLNASSSTPSWDEPLNGIEETAALALATPPAGAPYTVIDSSGDVGTWVDTNLATKPTLTPGTSWSNGFGADMAWSDPLYIATMGVVLGNNTAFGFWSGDGGNTWTAFATLAPGATANTGQEASIAVTARNQAVWAPGYSVPSYTTDNGATWIPTNLPPVSNIYPRAYHMAADRKNPNKVYAYDSGANWWGTPGKVYVSIDGGHTFTLSQSSVAAGLAPNYFSNTSLAVNPNAEGDLWLADGNAVYRSVDSGTTWTKLSQFASIMGSNPWPDVQGATLVALGKAAPGATYSAAVYVVGVVNGVWGVYRSDDAGVTWTRFNDDAHQFGGIGVMAADQNIYGRIYVSGTGRGVLYSN